MEWEEERGEKIHGEMRVCVEGFRVCENGKHKDRNT